MRCGANTVLWAGQAGQDSEDAPVEGFEWEEKVK